MSHKAIPDSSDEYCGTSYAAKLLNLSVGTVQTLVEKNELEAWKTQGGHRRISIQSIRDYQNRASLAPNAMYQDGKRLKVMVVEDDDLTRTMFQMHFDQWDLSIDTTITASAVEALLDISVLKPQVLLTDLRMPGIDGVEMLRQLNTHPLFAKLVTLDKKSYLINLNIKHHKQQKENGSNRQWNDDHQCAHSTFHIFKLPTP